MLAGVSLTKADNVSIFPTGYTFTDNLPSDCNYRYSMTQQIYTQEELGAANTFTGISFWNSLDMSKTRSLSDREERVFEVYLFVAYRQVEIRRLPRLDSSIAKRQDVLWRSETRHFWSG